MAVDEVFGEQQGAMRDGRSGGREPVVGHWLADGRVNCGEPFGAAFQGQPELCGNAVGDLPAWPEPVALGGVEVIVVHERVVGQPPQYAMARAGDVPAAPAG